MLKRRGQFKAKKGGLFDRNFHLGLMYGLFKKNHNIQIGLEYLQLQRDYLKGDPIDKWDNSYFGVYFGYRYLLSANRQKLNWFCFFPILYLMPPISNIKEVFL